ncbi:MAG: type II 3-dehydroquinate dehydratase [Anaerolineales bacterium]|jgi:3-dehydroquinate dehydratase-2|nr:type II 3-dehydroquinate dehydratase [Anaerolineales bacterium]
MTTILVLHGPNLNLLGMREPEIYGDVTIADINTRLKALGNELDLEIYAFQSNSEGELIDALHKSVKTSKGVIFNPGGYTHTSVALRDAVSAIEIPVVEVHLSNIMAREDFRHRSLISPACAGVISGFGWRSYTLALRALSDIIKTDQ